MSEPENDPNLPPDAEQPAELPASSDPVPVDGGLLAEVAATSPTDEAASPGAQTVSSTELPETSADAANLGPAEVAAESGEIDLAAPVIIDGENAAAPVESTPDAVSPENGAVDVIAPDTTAETAVPQMDAASPTKAATATEDAMGSAQTGEVAATTDGATTGVGNQQVAAPALEQAEPTAAPSVSILEVRELNWDAVRASVAAPLADERAERILAGMEERLASGGPLGVAFEEYAAGADDRVIQIGADAALGEVWLVGDLHGDLLALEAGLQHIDRSGGGPDARIVFLGDLFDDGVHAAEVVLRVFDLVLNGPMRVTVIAGNHDEALSFDGTRFQSSVLPSDFTEWLNARADHPWAARLGKTIIDFFARMPRALYFPDGLLVAHGGIPHTDLHAELEASGNWNDPRMLTDYVWLRAHPRARKRIPNRTTRGSEFGRDDIAAFAEVATRMGRPVARMVRGHDHVEERFELFSAYVKVPVLTINALSHRLPREVFGGYERVPVIARFVSGEVPEVRRLFIPPELIREVYPEPGGEAVAEPGA